MANLLTDSKGRVFIDRDGVLFRSNDDDDSGDVDDVDRRSNDNSKVSLQLVQPHPTGNQWLTAKFAYLYLRV